MQRGVSSIDTVLEKEKRDKAEIPMIFGDQTSSFQLRVPNIYSKVAVVFGASNVI